MKVKIFETKQQMGEAASEEAARILESAVKKKGNG